ncbi:hypothetical protein D9M68_857960 [compost metagenome]
MIDAGPVNGAHAHRAWRAIDVDFAAFQHFGALGDRIGRALFARDHFKDRAGAIFAAEQGLGIEAGGRIDNGGDLGVIDRNAGQKDTVLAATDDFSVLDDDGAEGAAPALFDRFNGKARRLFHEFFLVFRGRGDSGGGRKAEGGRGADGNGAAMNMRRLGSLRSL